MNSFACIWVARIGMLENPMLRNRIAETNITVGQWTKSEWKCHVTDHTISRSTKWLVGSVLLFGHWSLKLPLFLVLAWALVAIQHHKRSCCSRNGHVRNFDRQDVDVAGVRHRQTGPGPRGSSDLWCSCREYKSKLCSMEFTCRHGYLRESAYQHCGESLCRELRININGVVINFTCTSALFRQGQTRSWLWGMVSNHALWIDLQNMQSHSITGVLSHRIHQSSSQWWAINRKLVSDHVRSFLEVVWHIAWSLSESYIYICLWEWNQK